MNNSQFNKAKRNQTTSAPIIPETDKQQITESFNAITKELQRMADDIKLVCASAIMDDDYDKADVSKNAIMDIKKFVQDINALSTRWQQGIFNAASQQQPQAINTVHHAKPTRIKSSPTRLKVTFTTNNKEIQRRTAVETFAETLQLLKFEDVAKLQKQVSGYPLVTKTNPNPIINRSMQFKEWYINFPSNTQYKKLFLEEISTALKIPLQVDVV